MRTGDLVTVASSGGRLGGHGKEGTRLAIANGSPGVNTNVLSPPTFIDEPSGNGALNGIPVTATRART